MLGQWACAKCQTLIQAPVPAAVIGKGIATAGLMANLVVSKYIDHQPLFRLEAIMGRSGVSVFRSTRPSGWAPSACNWRQMIQAMLEDLLIRPCIACRRDTGGHA